MKKIEKLTIFRESPELWKISGKSAYHGMTLVDAFEYEKLKSRLLECEKVLKGYEKSVFGGPAKEYSRKYSSEYLSREDIFGGKLGK